MLRGFRGWLLLALAGAWGCRSAGWVPCFRQGDGATAQLAPSGRAVALVHASHYRALAGGEHPASLSCICDEARALFEREPDALVVVLNYDEATVRFNRAMIELGYDPFDWPEPLPPALIAAMQAIDDGPAPVDAAFNHRMGPERGGAQPPRGLRGYVYLPARQDLAGGRFLHEFAHFWAADIESPRVLARQIDRFHGHWGFSSMVACSEAGCPARASSSRRGGIGPTSLQPAGMRPWCPSRRSSSISWA